MSRYLFFVLLFLSAVLHAETSLRVGSKVLTLGDSAVRVQELMGQPDMRSFVSDQSGGSPDNQLAAAEQWQYAQDGKTEVITIRNGRIVKFDTLYN